MFLCLAAIIISSSCMPTPVPESKDELGCIRPSSLVSQSYKSIFYMTSLGALIVMFLRFDRISSTPFGPVVLFPDPGC
jgi:hypothetical protein